MRASTLTLIVRWMRCTRFDGRCEQGPQKCCGAISCAISFHCDRFGGLSEDQGSFSVTYLQYLVLYNEWRFAVNPWCGRDKDRVFSLVCSGSLLGDHWNATLNHEH